MTRVNAVTLVVAAAAVFSQLLGVSAQSPSTDSASHGPTFNKDVLPILQKHCQECHRPGEIAPMSLITYQDARPYARAIKKAVATRQMPPWDADDGYAKFSNDKRLTEADVQTLVAWSDAGAAEGDPNDRPAPIQFPDGWRITPDMIIEMPKDVRLPATGTVNYQNVLVRVNFPEDRWVVAAEMRPGNRKAVHHMRANLIPPGSPFMKDVVEGEPYENGDPRLGRADSIDLLGKFNPGLGDQAFNQFNSAKFVPKGSNIVFNLHYTATGEATTDRSRLGLVFAPRGWSPAYRYFVHNGPLAQNLAIPPYDGRAEVVAELTTQVPMKLAYVQPHMHLRGKDYELRVVMPSGESRTVIKGRWDFNWQLGHDLADPIDLPVGTRIISICHYDNSAANKANPDPAKLVFWGDQNWDEMQNIFIGVLVDPSLDQRMFFKASGPSLLPRGSSGPTLASLLASPRSGPAN